MAVSAAICLIVFALYREDMRRMDNGEPVLFSTWGTKYVPPGESGDDLTLRIDIPEDTVTTRGATINIVNDLDYDVMFSEYYALDRYENGMWIRLPAASGEGDWNDMFYVVESGYTAEFRIYWADAYGEIDSGKYRIEKIYTDDYNITDVYKLYGYFEIK